MTKAEYLAICSQRWDDIENLQINDNLYDYEKDFVDIWQSTGLRVFEKSLGELPNDHRKKKPWNDVWRNRN